MCFCLEIMTGLCKSLGEYFNSTSLHNATFLPINTAIKLESTLQPPSLLQPHLKKNNNNHSIA